jgi:hypothetical protein
MNTTSYRTGKKYNGSKEDYYRFTTHIRNVLRAYGIQPHLKVDYGVDRGVEY